MRMYALTLVLLLAGSSPARGDFMQVFIDNKTGFNANDLRLKFRDRVEQVKVKANATYTATTNEAARRNWIVDSNSGLQVNNGGSAKVLWENNIFNNTLFDGMWTANNVNLGFIIKDAAIMEISKDAFQTASVTFTNIDSFALVFTNTKLYDANLLSDYNIDQFDQITGNLVGSFDTFTLGTPSSGTETRTFSVGTVNPNGYLLLTGSVASSDNPSETLPFVVASLHTVPEPSTLTLFGISTLGLIGYAWRRRKRV